MTREVKDTLKYLEEASVMKTLASADKERIASLYETVLLKKLRRTNCSDCYRDACIEMACYIRRTGGYRQRQNYVLKCGALVNIGEFGEQNYYTRETITDEISVEFIRKHGESVLNLFESVPSNWREEIDSTATTTEKRKRAKKNESKGTVKKE